jgi:hypothetical protein
MARMKPNIVHSSGRALVALIKAIPNVFQGPSRFVG